MRDLKIENATSAVIFEPFLARDQIFISQVNISSESISFGINALHFEAITSVGLVITRKV